MQTTGDRYRRKPVFTITSPLLCGISHTASYNGSRQVEKRISRYDVVVFLNPHEIVVDDRLFVLLCRKISSCAVLPVAIFPESPQIVR